jgi:4-amino-4-deoxy-L-arabinose transferase-like glycosyltransferase
MRIGLFIVALAIRIAAIEATGASSMTFGDGPDYVATAQSICSQQVYPERGNLPFFRPPGLPFFIAGVTLCEPSRIRVIKYALAACDAATAIVIFEIAATLFGGVAALLAGLGAALYPFFIFSTTDVRSEPLFMLLLTLSILLLLRGNAAGSGVAVALAALTRPTALLCLPLFAVGVRWLCHRFPSARSEPPGASESGGRAAALHLLIAGALTLAPWIARNYLRFGEIIVVNDAASYSVWHAQHPETRRIYEADTREEFKRRELAFETKAIHVVAAEVAARANTPNGRDREWRRLAIEDFRREPVASLRFMLLKAGYYWRPWLNPIEHGRKAVIASALILIPLYVLAFIGLWRCGAGLRPASVGEMKGRPEACTTRPLAIAVLVYFAIIWLAHVPHQVVMRYRIPFVDPLLLVFAAYTICGWGYPKSIREDDTSANPMRSSLAVNASRDS